MRILYFAQARLATGLAEETISTQDTLSQNQLWQMLTQRHPSLVPLQSSCRLARNARLAQSEEVVVSQDEIAILPPVSGG